MSFLPNLLSFLRIPLAFAFLSESTTVRVAAIVLALLSDVSDGALARYQKNISKLGAWLDPIADKFFVLFALIVLWQESSLSVAQVVIVLSRDFAVMLFGLWLILMGNWAHYTVRSLWCGKATTALQFVTLLLLFTKQPVPEIFFSAFLTLGFLSLAELCLNYILQKSTVKG